MPIGFVLTWLAQWHRQYNGTRLVRPRFGPPAIHQSALILRTISLAPSSSFPPLDRLELPVVGMSGPEVCKWGARATMVYSYQAVFFFAQGFTAIIHLAIRAECRDEG